MTIRRILPLAALLLVPALSAMAQDSRISLDAPGLLPKKAKPGPPEPRAQPLAWPRLDPGSVICRSEDDLNRLAERRRGGPVAGTVDCQVIRVVTPISILQRKGPGATEIKTSDPKAGGEGWTDAWLPAKEPVQRR